MQKKEDLLRAINVGHSLCKCVNGFLLPWGKPVLSVAKSKGSGWGKKQSIPYWVSSHAGNPGRDGVDSGSRLLVDDEEENSCYEFCVYVYLGDFWKRSSPISLEQRGG